MTDNNRGACGVPGCDVPHPGGSPYRPSDDKVPVVIRFEARGQAASIWAHRVVERPEDFDAAWPLLEHRAVRMLMGYEADTAERYTSNWTVYDVPGTLEWARYLFGPIVTENFCVVPGPGATAEVPPLATPARMLPPRVFDRTLMKNESVISLAKAFAVAWIAKQMGVSVATATKYARASDGVGDYWKTLAAAWFYDGINGVGSDAEPKRRKKE